jgi:hypothetical protein
MTGGHVHHEASDVNIRAIFAAGFGLILVAALIHVLVWLLFLFFAGREGATVSPRYPLAASEATRLPPEPRLQTAPREDLRALRAREEAILNSYSWVDRNAGTVRIPIKEAMRIILEKGLPSRQEGK